MTSRGPLALTVRLARVEDTEPVLAFTRDTFDGWDYVPKTWAGWLAARDGLVLVAEATRATEARAAGLPVGPLAIARLALLSAGEGWLEGLRVHRAARGLRVATTLQVALLTWAQAQGATVVRFATGETNEGSRRLGARHGFRLAGRWRSFHEGEAADRPEQPNDRPGGSEADRVGGVAELVRRLRSSGLLLAPEPQGLTHWWERLTADPAARQASGLYESRAWSWQALTFERLVAHARAGQVLAADGDGAWALGILAHDEGVRFADPRFTLLAGDGTLALRLVEETRLAADRPVRLRLPEDVSLPVGGTRPIDGPTLAAIGYVAGDWAIVVLELPLADVAGRAVPIPAIGAGPLTYGGVPARRILVPPGIA